MVTSIEAKLLLWRLQSVIGERERALARAWATMSSCFIIFHREIWYFRSLCGTQKCLDLKHNLHVPQIQAPCGSRLAPRNSELLGQGLSVFASLSHFECRHSGETSFDVTEVQFTTPD